MKGCIEIRPFIATYQRFYQDCHHFKYLKYIDNSFFVTVVASQKNVKEFHPIKGASKVLYHRRSCIADDDDLVP